MSPTQLDHLSPSQVTLLRGETIVHRRGMVQLPTGARVSSQDLGESLIAVALLACVSQSVLELQIRSQTPLLGLQTGKALFSEPQQTSVPWPNSSLEARLTHLALQLQPDQRNRVQTLVYVLLGDNSADPWRQIVADVQGGLVALEIVERTEERGPLAAKHHQIRVPLAMEDPIAQLPAHHMRDMLMACRSTAPQLYRLMRKEISRGIRHRRKVPVGIRPKTMEEEWDESVSRLLIGE